MAKLEPTAYHSGKQEADNSATPWWIIRQIQAVVGVSITFDACATPETAKADQYYTKEANALSLNWTNDEYNYSDECFYMNPPFSMAKEFTNKAAEQARLGVNVLGLVKHAPDTTWFQENVEAKANYIYVPDKRINFVLPNGELLHSVKDGKKRYGGANFPVCFPLWLPFNNGGEAKQIRFKTDKKKYQTEQEFKLERQ